MFKRGLLYIAVVLVVLAVLTQDVEARRKILRGRKTITRTYYRKAGIPAWSIVVLIAFGEMIMGGIMYIVLKKFILDPPMRGAYSPPHTMERYGSSTGRL